MLSLGQRCSDTMDDLEAVRPLMFADITVSALADSVCLLQTLYGFESLDVLDVFTYFLTLSSDLAGIAPFTFLL